MAKQKERSFTTGLEKAVLDAALQAIRSQALSLVEVEICSERVDEIVDGVVITIHSTVREILSQSVFAEEEPVVLVSKMSPLLQ